MLRLIPIQYVDIPEFEDTSYAAMSDEEKRHMVQESLSKCHDDAYFEILAASDGNQIVGFMNLFARSAHIISIGPEIKRRYRGQSYGYQAEILALQHACRLGYTIASATVRDDNTASIALHEKLGFEVVARHMNQHGNPVRVYVKAL